MVLLRCFAFGCFWAVIFWLGLSVICGGVATSMSGAPPPGGLGLKKGYTQGYDPSFAAGAEFRERYGHYVMIAAAALSAAGTIVGVLPGTRRK